MNKYKNLLITTAISLAAITSIVAVSATSNNNGLFLGVIGDQVRSERTITANQTNRYNHIYAKDTDVQGGNGYECTQVVFFQLPDGAYSYVRASNNQSILVPENTCVLAIWADGNVNFVINSLFITNKAFYSDSGCTEEIDVVKFRHLTQIDIVLDNSEENRLTSKFTPDPVIGKMSEGVTDVENKCVTYTWTGNITSNDEVTFSAEGNNPGKVYWIRSLTFHYEC